MEPSTINAIIKGHRQFCRPLIEDNCIDKVWNNGHGAINFLRMTEDGQMLVNAAFWRKTDAKVAAAFYNAITRENVAKGIDRPNPAIICVDYCYPYYYSHSFGIHNPKTSAEIADKIKKDIAQYLNES